MSVELDTRYQVEAYNKIQKSINETGKAGIVMPTGTGKTYLALKLIEDSLDREKIVYVSPSPTLIVQIKKIINQTYTEEEAKTILSKVKFTTYSGLDSMYKHIKSQMREFSADIVILDEVHRSGAKDWSMAVDHLLEINENAKILGMTATPVRSDGQNMIEKRFGETAYELKISDAVARGILTLPLYISARYIFEDDIKNVQEKINKISDEKTRKEFQEKLNKARKSVEQAGGIKEIFQKYMKDGKWLIFCNPGDDIEELQETARKENWFDDINKLQTFLTIESKLTDTQNDIALRRFERKGGKDLRLLYSKNMLNEGIHDEEITGEIMLRPTKSYILFVQQLGRILSKDRPETPLVLDLVGNIKYFKEFRLEIQRIIQEGIKNGDTRYNEKTLEQFKILEEQENFVKAFEEIETSLEDYMDKSAVERLVDILEKLKNKDIDVTKLKRTVNYVDEDGERKSRSTYLYEIVPQKIIKELGLDPYYKIGRKIEAMLNVYRGRIKNGKVTEEIRERIAKLGFKLEEKTAISETLDILEILQSEGIDVTKIQQFVKEGDEVRGICLYEVKDERIEEIIQKYNLDRNFPLGNRLYSMMRVYRGSKNRPISDEEKSRLEALKLDREKKSTTEKALEIIKKLQSKGIDISKIQKNTRVNGKMRYTYLYEVIDATIIEELGLDPNERIGGLLTTLKKGYRGDLRVTMTEEEREFIEETGLITELDKKIAEQNRLKREQAEARKLKEKTQEALAKTNDRSVGNDNE